MNSIHDAHSALVVKRTMGIRREPYLDYMTFQAPGPPLFTEIFGPLVGLPDEWRAQGASPDEIDLSAFRYRAPQNAGVRVSTGWRGGPQPRILEETQDAVIGMDHYGRRTKLFKESATLPHPLDYPVSDFDDWLALKDHYVFDESRFGRDWKEEALRSAEEGYVVTVNIPGGFNEPRELMGEAALCEACYLNPELIQDILKTIGDTAYAVLDRVTSEIAVDQLSVHEDMAGASGPLFGPRQVKEFVGPFYRRIWDLVSSRGCRLFSQDSDGDMNPIIPDLLDAGVNLMYPNEPAAGMDIVQIRETYGNRLAFMGGIDKHVLRGSKDDILRELEYKIPPFVRSGGCVLALDHRITNGTPLENYRFYIRKAWEIMEAEYVTN